MADDDKEKETALVPSDEDAYVPPHDDYSYPQISDVLGDTELKNSLEDIIHCMEHPQIFEMMGTKPDKSYLFNGPPGTGKTFAAKAVRNHIGRTGKHVVWMPYEIGLYGTAYINMGAKIAQQFFTNGRKMAKRGATILYFIDEADVVFGQRHNERSSHKEDDKLLNTFMTNIQQINDSDSPEYIFLATNFSKAMDEAAIRSGRVNRIIEFPLPSQECLMVGYERYVRQANKRAKYEVFEKKIDYERLAVESRGFNYADVAEVVNQAIRTKAFEFLRNQEEKITVVPTVSEKDLYSTISKHRKARASLDHSLSGTKRIGFGS